MIKEKFDLTVIGGGASGIACAYISAKYGLKTLLVEKNIALGGLMTSGLVVPAMKVSHQNINTEFFDDLLAEAELHNARITYCDGNPGWFNPEILKIVFLKMLKNVNCKILLNTEPNKIVKIKNGFDIGLKSKGLSLYIETNYLADGTGSGEIAEKFSGCEKINFENRQDESLRFICGGINSEKFVEFLKTLQEDEDISTYCCTDGEYYFSTSYTSDNRKRQGLEPLFKDALCKDLLTENDCRYFQIFSVAKMPGHIAFNCPRIPFKEDIYGRSEAYVEGYFAIERILNFCKKYLPGFENAYLTSIASIPGIREEGAIKGKITFSEEYITSGEKPENIALASDYPIDIHSSKDGNELSYSNKVWYLPTEALISEKNDDLFVIGKCISATFKAQSAVRTQVNCFSTGEAVAKYCVKHLRNSL